MPFGVNKLILSDETIKKGNVQQRYQSKVVGNANQIAAGIKKIPLKMGVMKGKGKK